MFKRLFWLAAGVGVGLWLQRRMRAQVERYAPEQVAQRASATVRSLGDDVRDAAREGLAAMKEREESLRTQFRPTAR
ncbi:MAG: hypothetical protein ACRD12_23110 [Acidimicrobiales bacterium]